MLVVTNLELYMATLKHNGTGQPLKIPRHYLPDDIDVGDVVRIVKDEVASKRKQIEEY